MKHLLSKPIVYLFSLFFLVTGCSKEDTFIFEESNSESQVLEFIGEKNALVLYQDNQGPHKHHASTSKEEGFMESFESGTKGSYALDSVSLISGMWTFDDALLGSLTNDRKYGSKSVRIRNTGYVVMNFNMDYGASSVSIRHAVYGNDSASNWQFIASYDDGISWYFIGNEITSNSTEFNTVTFEVNETQSVRFGIYKTTGGSNRINFDNIEIQTIQSTGDEEPSMDSNLTFGNPSNANTSPNNYFLSKPDFSLSYNNANGTPNWVSWHLSAAWLGTTSRCNCFKSDSTLPSNFFKAVSSDYTNTGFDRGHLCPSADRNGTEDSNENTYYMTNIAPQAPDNNQNTWVNFENYLRSLVDDGNEVHVISGVYGTGGTGRFGYVNSISNNQINVPNSFWKVALVLPNGSNDINRVTTTTRIIAINVPNDQNISADWTQFKTTVDVIENLTGFDLFENIPDAIEVIVEATIDSEPSS